MAADRIHAAHDQAERGGDAPDFVADMADAEKRQGLAGIFAAGQVVAPEPVEFGQLLRQAAEQGGPQEHGLLGDGPHAIERQVAERRANRGADGVAIGE